MKNPTIADTPYGMALDIRSSALGAAAYLIKNAGVVLGDEELDILKNVRIHVRSPFTDIYQRVIESNKLSCFTVVDFSTTTLQNIPEILTLNDITIDGKYIAQNIPAEYQNAWVNISPILGKRDAYNSNIIVTDTPRLAALIARGMLCMNYNDSNGWLNPAMCTIIIESYATMMGAHLKSLFNLDINETMLVYTLFSAYYAQLLGGEDDPMEVPPLLYRCTRFLGTPNEINERLNIFRETRESFDHTWKLSIDRICKLLNTDGPSRLKVLNSKQLYVTMSRGSIDSQAMLLSLDYPPYWVYQLLSNIQGTKNPNIANLIKFTDMKKKLLMFANDLTQSKLFIERVNR